MDICSFVSDFPYDALIFAFLLSFNLFGLVYAWRNRRYL